MDIRDWEQRREYTKGFNRMKRVIWSLAIFFCLPIQPPVASPLAPQTAQNEERININTASVETLQQLPGIGVSLAGRIVAHRQKYGPFRRPQDIIIVRGMSAKRYRRIADRIRI
jgi:competence protein ComEA